MPKYLKINSSKKEYNPSSSLVNREYLAKKRSAEPSNSRKTTAIYIPRKKAKRMSGA